MKQISDSLMNIITTTLKNLDVYEIKRKLPEHNKIDKPLQSTLNLLILQERDSFKNLLENANYLMDEITVNNTQVFKENGLNDIISKLEFLHNHDIIIEEDSLQKIIMIKDNLDKTSESINRHITKYLSL